MDLVRYYVDLGTITWPPEVYDYNEKFTRALSVIKRRHDPVVTTVAQGILEYKDFISGPADKKLSATSTVIDRSIQTFLDRFYMSRIGIRVLIGQHIALNKLEPHPDYVGVICTNTNVYQICREAIDNAMFICEEHYGLFKPPSVQLVCPKDLSFMYVPSHLVCFSICEIEFGPRCDIDMCPWLVRMLGTPLIRTIWFSRSSKTHSVQLLRGMAWTLKSSHLSK